VTRIHFTLHVVGDAADALQIRDRGAAKLHHQAGHGELAHLSGTILGMMQRAPAQKGAYT